MRRSWDTLAICLRSSCSFRRYSARSSCRSSNSWLRQDSSSSAPALGQGRARRAVVSLAICSRIRRAARRSPFSNMA